MTELEHRIVGTVVLMLIYLLGYRRYYQPKVKDKNEWNRIIGKFF